MRLTMLTPSPRLTYAFACSSFLRRPIALLNAFIIPSYIISWSWNVLVKIAPSLIGKKTLWSSQPSGFSSPNFGANSVIISSNPFLSM